MLRNRSRAASKQTFMADQTLLLSPTKTTTNPNSSFSGSPRIFKGLLTKTLSDSETVAMSPTSILDAKFSSSFVNPFGNEIYSSKTSIPSPSIKNFPCTKLESEAIGLALIDTIKDTNDGNDNFSKPVNRKILLASNLKVQIPSMASVSSVESPKSPADFGIKTWNSKFLSPFSCSQEKNFTKQLSLKEMELSEEYTCVITHGPKPQTTRIFDNCIVESCCGNDPEIFDHQKIGSGFEINVSTSPSPNFLSFCHTCKDSLEQGKDIYIYRGEKAFCSHECRLHEMVIERQKNPELDVDF